MSGDTGAGRRGVNGEPAEGAAARPGAAPPLPERCAFHPDHPAVQRLNRTWLCGACFHRAILIGHEAAQMGVARKRAAGDSWPQEEPVTLGLVKQYYLGRLAAEFVPLILAQAPAPGDASEAGPAAAGPLVPQPPAAPAAAVTPPPASAKGVSPEVRRRVCERLPPLIAAGETRKNRCADELNLSRSQFWRALRALGLTFESLTHVYNRTGSAVAVARTLWDAAPDLAPPWPLRDASEDLETPAITRKAARAERMAPARPNGA